MERFNRNLLTRYGAECYLMGLKEAGLKFTATITELRDLDRMLYCVEVSEA